MCVCVVYEACLWAGHHSLPHLTVPQSVWEQAYGQTQVETHPPTHNVLLASSVTLIWVWPRKQEAGERPTEGYLQIQWTGCEHERVTQLCSLQEYGKKHQSLKSVHTVINNHMFYTIQITHQTLCVSVVFFTFWHFTCSCLRIFVSVFY